MTCEKGSKRQRSGKEWRRDENSPSSLPSYKREGKGEGRREGEPRSQVPLPKRYIDIHEAYGVCVCGGKGKG